MTGRANVQPQMIRWARERAGKTLEDLQKPFPRLASWEAGEAQPTLRQLQAFAEKVHVPFGYLFLPAPPEEKLPVEDFRVMPGQDLRAPSIDLLDTIHLCQVRQEWYRAYAEAEDLPRVTFYRSASVSDRAEDVACRLSESLDLDQTVRKPSSSWEDALRKLRDRFEDAGILVMMNGVVGSNTRRRLDPREFRGFALADDRAPLIFVNASDTKAAQIFTLAHELGHIVLGSSGVSEVFSASGPEVWPARAEEVWCNAFAAELLVPEAELKSRLDRQILSQIADALRGGEPVGPHIEPLARAFRVSTLVILRRLLDAGALPREEFPRIWHQEAERLSRFPGRAGRPANPYMTALARLGRRFTSAVVESAYSGQMGFADAFRLVGTWKPESFHRLGQLAGAIP